MRLAQVSIIPLLAIASLHTTLSQTPVARPEASIFALEAGNFSIQTSVKHTFESDFRDAELGSISSTIIGAVVTLPIDLGNSFRLQTGASYERIEFSNLSTSLIPDQMQGLAAVIGLEYLVNDKPAIFLRASPGVYFIDSASSDSFDIPTSFGGAWRFTDQFMLLYGATYAGFRENPVLPFLGFLWDVTDEIEFNLTFPTPNLTYKFSDSLHFSIIGEYRGLSVDTAGDVADPRYTDTELSYRELAIGTSATYLFNEDTKLTLSAGYTFQRRFRYESPERSIRSDGAPFVGLTLRARF